MNLNQKISVILPTIGRESLSDVLLSICQSKSSIGEILIVDDSQFGLSKELFAIIDKISFVDLKIIRTKGLIGSGAARNQGLELAKCNWVAFADDDDPWIPSRLTRQFEIMSNLGLMASLCLNSPGTSIYSPWTGAEDPLYFLYMDKGFRRHTRFLPFGTLLFNREIYKKIFFDNGLCEREDLWFLHEIYNQDNRVMQLNLIGCHVKKELFRSLSRPSISCDIEWYRRLYALDSKLAKNFIKYISIRNSIYTRNWRKCFSLLFFLLKNSCF
jgi:glycosyltransferase involved in cell wall biosynthesis